MGVSQDIHIMHATQVLLVVHVMGLIKFSGAFLPQYTKEVTITAEDTPITITATYGATEGKKEETYIFEEKSEDMGSWRSVRKIIKLKGQIGDDGKVFERDIEKDCERVHANIDYTVNKDGVFKVMQKS